MNNPEDMLSRKLDYEFRDPELLKQALRHRSAGGAHNERIEFLGDGLLNFVIAEALFRMRDRATEGELSRLRALLVRRETLAELARELDLGEYLTLGSGELKSGGHRRSSILADAMEAVMGAVFLDGGFETGKSLILRLYERYLQNLPSKEELKDPKTRLQEYLQSRGRPLPEYEVVSVSGKAHEQKFVVECRVEGLDGPLTSEGTSRRKAEQAVARKTLERLQEVPA